jgi:hypothetical protein
MRSPDATAASDVPPARINLSLAPDQRSYDPADPQLRAAANLLQKALNADTVQQEEALWTELIDTYRDVKADWVPDIVGRCSVLIMHQHAADMEYDRYKITNLYSIAGLWATVAMRSLGRASCRRH